MITIILISSFSGLMVKALVFGDSICLFCYTPKIGSSNLPAVCTSNYDIDNSCLIILQVAPCDTISFCSFWALGLGRWQAVRVRYQFFLEWHSDRIGVEIDTPMRRLNGWAATLDDHQELFWYVPLTPATEPY
ncbi:hypothetical protein EDD36DRAFT_74456 [Exophiala viscosa]|uniref:Uncharacterized protein n=1 Tax=Exophiala viscosa TaxID=2486360 RepID=A0AAN6DPA9_9EURO|nr:hypothetical protein EDD36DRAFT_74456 [Exophiala viscosa]